EKSGNGHRRGTGVLCLRLWTWTATTQLAMNPGSPERQRRDAGVGRGPAERTIGGGAYRTAWPGFRGGSLCMANVRGACLPARAGRGRVSGRPDEQSGPVAWPPHFGRLPDHPGILESTRSTCSSHQPDEYTGEVSEQEMITGSGRAFALL